MPDLTTAQGVTWHYDREGEGEPLLFLHGWSVDRRIWRQQVKYFSASYEVFAVDLPGHGQSVWPSGLPLDLGSIASGVQRILDGRKAVRVAASSFGGLVALSLIGQSPQTVSACALVGSPPRFLRGEDFPFGLESKQIEKLKKQITSDYPSIVRIFFRSLFSRQERASRRYRWIQTFRRAESVPQKEVLTSLLDVLVKSDLRDVLFGLKIPVCFLTGSEDTFFPRGLGEEIGKHLPQARFSWFEQCGHFPFLSKPHEFNARLERFFQEAKA